MTVKEEEEEEEGRSQQVEQIIWQGMVVPKPTEYSIRLADQMACERVHESATVRCEGRMMADHAVRRDYKKDYYENQA